MGTDRKGGRHQTRLRANKAIDAGKFAQRNTVTAYEEKH
jgi:hypothetical protein